jgi:hypothetical protein
MKKTQIAAVLMVLCMFGVSSATSILWCSGKDNTDYGWTDLLTAEGYTVDRLEEATVMTQDKVNLANTYDLVIVGRDVISGDWNNSGEAALWNSITAPMICQSGYLWRNNIWKWLNSNSTHTTNTSIAVDLASDHALYPILFNGVTISESGLISYTTSSVTLSQTRDAGNGILIGHRNYDPQPWVYAAYWAQGVEFYSGSGYYASGPRMALGGGSPDDSIRGAYNLNENGKRLFLNAVYFMSGATFNRKPSLLVYDRIANTNEAVVLDGSVYDPDSTVTAGWTQVSGPATAVFEDSAVLNATVTFPVKGVYVLEIAVSDGTTTLTDQITVTVRDNADNALIAHWDFASLPDPNTLVDLTGNGYHGIYYGAAEPNVVAGNMFGGSQAADLTVNQVYWEVANSYSNPVDPNLSHLASGMTAAAWVRITDNSIGAPMIVGNGLDGWRLQVNMGAFNFVCKDTGFDINADGFNAYDGIWHHVVAVFDGVASQAYIYVDGQLAGTSASMQGNLLAEGDDYPLVQIANRGDADRPWKGYIDDIRIYNYPLSSAEIASLASEGNRIVAVNAGADQTLIYKGTPIQLEGTLPVDDGFPAYASVAWSVVSAPFEVDHADIVFSNVNLPNSQVEFPNVQGDYILRLTADDTEHVVFDDVKITITIPTCSDVIADGYGIPADLSGPQGTPDCRVDMYDLAALANNWLDCNDPDDVNCDWAYQQ